ncbi:MAG TPA: hypothetical protein VIV64_05870, partial [Gammaproteobacteria bacterium]
MSATVALGLAGVPALAQDAPASLLEAAETKLDEARSVDAALLSPANFERAMERYADAVEDLARGRSAERIQFSIDEVIRLLDQAIDASEIAAVTLASLIKTREDALNADAPTFAPEAWPDAESMFEEAARRLETGNIRQAREISTEAETVFRDAELTAIKAQYLSQTRALLARAEQLRVPRYAPQTFSRAQALLLEAETQLNENRYDTDLPRSLAQQANYEARHAIFLAGQIEQIDEEETTAEN